MNKALIGIELPDATVLYSQVDYTHNTSLYDLLNTYYTTENKATEIINEYTPDKIDSVENYIEDNQDLYDMIFLYVGGNWEQVAFKF